MEKETKLFLVSIFMGSSLSPGGNSTAKTMKCEIEEKRRDLQRGGGLLSALGSLRSHISVYIYRENKTYQKKDAMIKRVKWENRDLPKQED